MPCRCCRTWFSLVLITSSNVVGRSTGRVAGLRPLQDAVHVQGGAVVEVGNAARVRHQAAHLRVEVPRVHRGQPMPDRHRRDHGSIGLEDLGVGPHQQRAHPGAGDGRERPRNLVGTSDLEDLQLEPSRPRGRVQRRR